MSVVFQINQMNENEEMEDDQTRMFVSLLKIGPRKLKFVFPDSGLRIKLSANK